MVLRCGDARDGLCARLAAPCAAVAMARGWLLLSARDAGGSPDGAVLEMGCGNTESDRGVSESEVDFLIQLKMFGFGPSVLLLLRG